MGVIYTQQEINDSLKGMAPFITGDLGDAKTGGHGTGCATVAAANDNNKKAMVGVAPKADLIIVRAADDTVDEDGLPHASLLNQICAHVLKLAKDHNKPVVLSCSFGTNSNVRPGRLIEDRQLSERFPLDKPGQAICISAGNANELKTQAHAVLDEKGTSQKITWVSPGLTNTIMLFFNTDDKKAIKLEGPYAQRITDSLVYNPITKGWQTDPTKAPKVGDKSADPPDTDYLIASSAGGKKITVDCFLNGTAQFIEPAFSRARTVGSPGRTANAITVGSYDWNNVFQDRVLATWSSGTGGAEYHNMVIGQLSSYSSRGPGIGDYQPGTSKPDVVSPGEYFTVHYPQQFLRAQKKQDVNFFDGTSAATPYTAGVIALMMEAKRDLTIAQIRDMFTKHVLPRSNSDAFVKDSFAQYGPLPNGAWGYGRLNRAAVEGILDDILAQSKK
jgi:subtilisin family serine protease